jgi:hypothetical protein
MYINQQTLPQRTQQNNLRKMSEFRIVTVHDTNLIETEGWVWAGVFGTKVRIRGIEPSSKLSIDKAQVFKERLTFLTKDSGVELKNPEIETPESNKILLCDVFLRDVNIKNYMV